MTQPSAPLLEWLRKLLDQRGMNTAQLAAAAKLPRQRVRKVLTGAEPMLVDELLTLTQALEVQPKDLGMADLPVPAEEEDASPRLATPTEPAKPKVDPWGNHPRQLIEVGFALGCDFGLVVDTAQLGASGIPKAVLERYQGGPMRIQLDAAYHKYNAPRYADAALTITLSFDALYDCTFPWAAFQQVVFTPVPPEVTAPEPEAPAPGRPRLRLVT